MNTNKHELLFKEEVYQVVGCAMEVLNTLGHGLFEKPYMKICVHSCLLVVQTGSMRPFLMLNILVWYGQAVTRMGEE